MPGGGICWGSSFQNDLAPATREEGAIMTPKEKIIQSIIRLLRCVSLQKMEDIYNYVKHKPNKRPLPAGPLWVGLIFLHGVHKFQGDALDGLTFLFIQLGEH